MKEKNCFEYTIHNWLQLCSTIYFAFFFTSKCVNIFSCLHVTFIPRIGCEEVLGCVR